MHPRHHQTLVVDRRAEESCHRDFRSRYLAERSPEAARGKHLVAMHLEVENPRALFAVGFFPISRGSELLCLSIALPGRLQKAKASGEDYGEAWS